MNTHNKSNLLCVVAAIMSTLLSAAAAQAQKPELVLQSGHNEIIRALAISPDGKYLASAGLDRTIIIWDIPSGRQLTSFRGHAEFIFGLAFAPDGKHLASGSADGIVYVWDVAEGVRKHQATLGELGITSLAFSPDGKMLAISCVDKKVMLGRISEKSAGELTGFKGVVTQIAFSPDGKYMAITTRDKSEALGVVDLTTKEQVFGWAREEDGFTSVAFSPDSRHVAAASVDESITVWRTRDWEVTAAIPPAGTPDKIRRSIEKQEGIDQRVLRRLFGDSGFVAGSLAFTSDKELTFADGFRVRTWDVAANKAIPSREIASAVGSYVMAVSKDGHLLAFNEGPDVRLLDLRTRQLKELKSAGDKITALDLIHGGRTLAAIYGGSIGVWNYDGLLTKTEWNRIQLGMSGYIGTPVTSTDEFACHCAGTDESRSLKLLDFATLKPRAFLKGHTEPITAATIHHDGNMLASRSGDGTIKIWDVKRRALLKTLKSDASHISFSPVGNLLAAAGWDTVTFWNVETWEARSEKKPTFNIDKMLFSPDSKVLAATGMINPQYRKHLILWDALTGKLRHSLSIDSTSKEDQPKRAYSEPGHQTTMGEIKTNFTASGPMAFSRDSRFVASEEINRITGTHQIKIFDVNTGAEVHTLAGHDASVRHIIFSSNDKVLISGGWDKTIKFWDTEKGTQMATFVPLGDSDWVIFTPDGRFDTNMSLEEVERLHWVMPRDALSPLPLDIFMRDYYEPKLLGRILAGAALKPVRDIFTLNRTQPVVVIKEVRPDGEGTVQVTVEVANAVSSKQFDPQGRALESGVYDVRLFRDRQMVGTSTAEAALETYVKMTGALNPTASFSEAELTAWRQAHRVRLEENGRGILIFSNVKLPRNGKSKEVMFSAYAFNNDRVKSVAAHKLYALPPVTDRPRKGRAYIITVGVNLHENPSFNLSFAANDARQMQQALTTRLTSARHYEEVVSVSLISDSARGTDGAATTQTDATKAKIRAALLALSGKGGGATPELRSILNADKLRTATPDDLVLILFAGHGYTGSNGLFYLIPYDTGTGVGKVVTPQLQLQSISSEELSLWLRDVDAGHMALIVDACHSAAAVESAEFKPGPMGNRGLGQLAYDKGMLILAATQADNVAREGGPIRKGWLSHVLVSEGLEEMKADFEPTNGTITLREWLRYGVVGVPQLFNKIAAGQARAFPDVTVDDVVLLLNDQQQPSLFDFARRGADVTLVSAPPRR
jgi:WD40 repeat protein